MREKGRDGGLGEGGFASSLTDSCFNLPLWENIQVNAVSQATAQYVDTGGAFGSLLIRAVVHFAPRPDAHAESSASHLSPILEA